MKKDSEFASDRREGTKERRDFYMKEKGSEEGQRE